MSAPHAPAPQETSAGSHRRSSETRSSCSTELIFSRPPALMDLQIVTLLLLAAATAASEVYSPEIEFKDDGAILKCPNDANSGATEWYGKGPEKLSSDGFHTVKAHLGTVEGQFRCKYNKVEHMFYINAKVCKNCVEFGGAQVLAVILADLLLTGGVILIVYKCASKNSPNTQQKASNPRSSNPPRPPNPDYAPLNPSTLSSGLYAGINKT